MHQFEPIGLAIIAAYNLILERDDTADLLDAQPSFFAVGEATLDGVACTLVQIQCPGLVAGVGGPQCVFLVPVGQEKECKARVLDMLAAWKAETFTDDDTDDSDTDDDDTDDDDTDDVPQEHALDGPLAWFDAAEVMAEFQADEKFVWALQNPEWQSMLAGLAPHVAQISDKSKLIALRVMMDLDLIFDATPPDAIKALASAFVEHGTKLIAAATHSNPATLDHAPETADAIDVRQSAPDVVPTPAAPTRRRKPAQSSAG